MQSPYAGNGEKDREEFDKLFRRNPHAFALDEFESNQLESLLGRGYFFSEGFFSKSVVDHIHVKADAIFRIMPKSAAPKTEITDPLVQVSEVLDIAFHESILKIVAHFFKHIPPVFRVSIVRYFPRDYAPGLNRFRQETHDSDSLELLIDLVTVDQMRGPLVYVPGSNLYGSYRPRLLSAFGLPVDPRQLEDWEVERMYSREKWETLYGERGSVTAIHRRGLAKGPTWALPGNINNKPRTAIQIDITGHRPGARYDWKGNRMPKWNFDRMSRFQQVFAHPAFVKEQMLA